MSIIKAFDEYVKYGFEPIAIYEGQKIPIGNNWNKNWSASKWRPIFCKNPNLNIGILLGKIVDVEGDSDLANKTILDRIGKIKHPQFYSNKSIHHLFLNDDLNLTRKVFGKIEFRAYTHQSIVPPSKHLHGNFYEWITDFRTEIPLLPDALKEFLINSKKTKNNFTKSTNANKTKTFCNACKKKFFVEKKRLKLEIQAFAELDMIWMCRKCRDLDLRPRCKELRQIPR